MRIVLAYIWFDCPPISEVEKKKNTIIINEIIMLNDRLAVEQDDNS